MFKPGNSFILFIIFILTGSYTPPKTDDHEIVKQFRPDDHYFTATMKSLHFIIDASSVERLNTLFDQIVREKNLPVSAAGMKDGVYTGGSPCDAFDYKHIVKLTMKDGKIIGVDYN